MPDLIPAFVAEKYRNGISSGSLQAAAMFIDISGFTAMTRALMANGKEGAEVLNDVLNAIYEPIIEAVYDRGGFISSFEGDAFTALFPQPVKPLDCCHSAAAIIKIFNEIGHLKTKFGEFDLYAKVGLGYGMVEWGVIGSETHKTWFFRGKAISAAVKAEKRCGPMQVILNHSLHRLVKSEVEVSPLSRDFSRFLTFHEIEPERSGFRAEEISAEIARQFLPDSVISYRGVGEFRDVVCVFVSFRKDDPNQATYLLDRAGEFGGYFEGLNYSDKGGNCLVIFGAPVTYENYIQRAVNFAETIRSEFKADVRIGITAGTVFAGIKGSERRAIYGVIGDVVNLSARFMMKAKWGEVWFDQNVTKSAGAGYETKALRPRQFKGFEKKVPVHRLLAKKGSPRVSFFQGEMVGRETEMSRLVELLRPVKEGKFGGIVYVYGNPGIGKSRLLYELTRQQGFRTLTLQTDNILKKSLNPFTYFFNHYFEQFEAGSVDERKVRFTALYDDLIERIERLLDERVLRSSGSWRADIPVRPKGEGDLINGRTGMSALQELDSAPEVKELKRIDSLIGSLVGLFWESSIYEQIEPKNRPLAIQFAIKEFFKALSLVEPIILLIEDIQWLDAESQALFSLLTRKIEDYPIIILASSRFNDDGSKLVLKVDKEVQQHEIVLPELPHADLNSLITNQLGDPADADLAAYIHARTEGNPFYAEQFCLYLKENSLVELEAGHYRLTREPDEIPATITAIMIARIDRLSAELKKTVQVASVLGREFEVRVLDELIKLLQAADTYTWAIYWDQGIEPLVSSAEKERIWAALSELRYIFSHALLRDAVYEMQLRGQIRGLHRLAGDTMVKLYLDEKSRLADIADHFEKGEVWEKAAEYLFKAAEAAREWYSNQAALEYYDRLLKLYTERPETSSPQTVVKARLGKAAVLELTGEWGAAEEEHQRAVDLACEIADRPLAARALNRRGNLFILMGEYNLALDDFQKSLAIAEELGDKRLISSTVCDMGTVFFNRCDYDRALECFQKYLSIAEELGDKLGISVVVGNMGTVFWSRGDYDRALECLQKRLSIAEELGDKQGISHAVGNMGVIFYDRGDYDRALEGYQKQLSIAEELGDKQGISHAVGNMGNVFMNRGDYDRAIECYQKRLSMAEELGDKPGISNAAGKMGVVLFELMDCQRASELFERSIGICRELDLKPLLAEFLPTQARLALAQNQHLQASSICSEALTLSQELKDNDKIVSAQILSHKINFLAAEDDPTRAATAESLAALLEQTESDEAKAEIHFELTTMHRTLNHPDQAERHRQEAIRLYESLYAKIPKYAFKKRIEELKAGRLNG